MEEFQAVLSTVAVGGWREAWDPARERVYYYHAESQETRWEAPVEDREVTEFLRTVGINL